jgi:hypothetical protein
VGIELLRREEWPPREDDVRRFVSLLRLLRKHCTDTTHLAAVEREDWGSRFRSVEVAAATSVAALPCSFREAAEAAKKILDAFADNAP